MSIPNPNFTQLLSSTTALYSKKVSDAVTNSVPLLALLSGGLTGQSPTRVKSSIKIASGGTVLTEQIQYTNNTNVKFLANGFSERSIQPQNVLTSASYNWKMLNGTYPVEDLLAVQNSGETQMHNLIKNVFLNNLTASLTNVAGVACYALGTEDGGASFGGLRYIISDTPSVGTMGGIDRADAANAFWRNQLFSAAAESVTISATTIVSAMDVLMLRCSGQANRRPNVIFADANYFNFYQAAAQTVRRITESKIGDIGFNMLDYQGIPVIYDPNCPADHMYFVDTTAISLQHAPGQMFRSDPAVRTVGQNVSVYGMTMYGNLTASNPRSCGVLKA